MIKKNITIFLLSVLLLISCSARGAKPVFVATANPVYQIIKEIAGTKAEVKMLMKVGDSPHTYSPTPSDARITAGAKALFFISDHADGWAANMESENKIELIKLLPDDKKILFGKYFKNNDSTADPHFWTDPLAVKAILPALADSMAKYDPENAKTYKVNADLFAKRLNLLNRQVEKIISEVKGKKVYLFHPSFLYFLQRYGLRYGGSIEPAPGKEPTPVFISAMVKELKKNQVKAIFSEPQLPDGPARILAEASGTRVFILDPLGGEQGREKYTDIILYNARTFKKALGL